MWTGDGTIEGTSSLTFDATTLYANSILQLGQVSAPGTTTDKLYNVSGRLYYNGVEVTQEAIGIACSDESTDLTTGDAKATFRMPYAMPLTEVRANVTLAPAGSNISVAIRQGGSDILSTDITIDDGEKTSKDAATPPVISTSALTDDAEIKIDLDAVGSGTAGQGLKVWLIGYR